MSSKVVFSLSFHFPLLNIVGGPSSTEYFSPAWRKPYPAWASLHTPQLLLQGGTLYGMWIPAGHIHLLPWGLLRMPCANLSMGYWATAFFSMGLSWAAGTATLHLKYLLPYFCTNLEATFSHVSHSSDSKPFERVFAGLIFVQLWVHWR